MKEDLSPRLKALGSAEMRRNLLKGLQMAAVMEAKRLVPRKTGNLDRSIRRGPINDDRALILAGGVGEVGYAAHVEFGTKGGQMLRPVKKKALAWGGNRRLSGTQRSGAKAEFFRWATNGAPRSRTPTLCRAPRRRCARLALARS